MFKTQTGFGFRVSSFEFNPKPRNRNSKHFLRTAATLLTLLGVATMAQAAPKSELWPRWQKNDAASKQKIDHAAWDAFLKKYVVVNPGGINRVRYATVTPDDRTALINYVKSLEAVSISTYSRAEQRAYWINLYNAKTVELILSRFPVKSIRDINISPGLFVSGPWGAKNMTVEGEKISLDDIEHRILRPIWKDNRVHYAVNCASNGCPNLQPTAFTTENMESLLDKGAREYINHPRGVSLTGGKLKVSSIYVWFQEDFGSTEGLMQHWGKYATGALADGLKSYNGGLEHDYDWNLNGAN
ncbi:MAG: DUF547 domain-containing protein [Deltaproteobacteria bacterium]|nr:DUF547 domain-containing protein [Deltaproteobacteria bacterium]